MITIKIKEETLTLLPERAILWSRTSRLFIADLHLGKTSHFRKEGIGIPNNLIEEDYKRLEYLLNHYGAKEVFLLGDLFHSDYNSEWKIVEKLFSRHSDKNFHLVIGNHDILDPIHYFDAGLIVHKNELSLPPFILSHEPPNKPKKGLFTLCGHIHPGVKIKGKGRQCFRLPCFYFSKNYAILPAFGTFTGIKTLRTLEEDEIYAIIEKRVVNIRESSLQN